MTGNRAQNGIENNCERNNFTVFVVSQKKSKHIKVDVTEISPSPQYNFPSLEEPNYMDASQANYSESFLQNLAIYFDNSLFTDKMST